MTPAEMDKLGYKEQLKQPAPKGLGTSWDDYQDYIDQRIRKLTMLRMSYLYTDIEYVQLSSLIDGWLFNFPYEVYLRWRSGLAQK